MSFITSTAEFTPYSVEDYLKPILIQNEAYEKSQQSNLDLISKINTIKSSLYNDPDLQGKFDQFNQGVTQMSDYINSGNYGDAQRLGWELKKTYASEFEPLITSIATREAQDKQWLSKFGNDPTYIGERPITMSLNNFTNGNTPSRYGISGGSVFESTQKVGKAIINKLARQNDANNQKWGIDHFAGLISNKAIDEFKTGNVSSDNPLLSTVEFIRNSYGYDDLKTEAQKAQFDKYVIQGLDTIVSGANPITVEKIKASNYRTYHSGKGGSRKLSIEHQLKNSVLANEIREQDDKNYQEALKSGDKTKIAQAKARLEKNAMCFNPETGEFVGTPDFGNSEVLYKEYQKAITAQIKSSVPKHKEVTISTDTSNNTTIDIIAGAKKENGGKELPAVHIYKGTKEDIAQQVANILKYKNYTSKNSKNKNSKNSEDIIKEATEKLISLQGNILEETVGLKIDNNTGNFNIIGMTPVTHGDSDEEDKAVTMEDVNNIVGDALMSLNGVGSNPMMDTTDYSEDTTTDLPNGFSTPSYK